MNIKSLLLGSAAALVAVSGARAADMVVAAEPEPVEYVRVCDVYGTGFFYLPGTETCLKISGYVRVDIRGGDLLGKTSNANEETYNNRARFQLRADARSETELGTLRSYAAVNFNYQGTGNGSFVGVDDDGDGDIDRTVQTGFYDNDDSFGIDHAYIELGGFRIGKTDSLFSTFTDYSSGVLNDGLIPYGPFATLQIAYTYTGPNGFSAAIALEQGDEDEGEGASGITEDYAPYVVGGVSLTQGWGKVGIVAGYDSWEEEVAIKGRVDVNFTETASAFVMAAWDSGGNDFNGVFDQGTNFYAPWDGDWALWAGTAIKLNEKATFNAEIGWDEAENFSVAANIAYELVPGFVITPEVDYVDNFDVDDSDAWGVNVRFQRNF
ncbi:porin [Pseudaminobacter sp. 19-2017]|uniref:Porin n=1 Tax=Pseudaminobacter soli (ex Zhang et al. 2022) TaxID=2831468 RepID=A0A942E539_9HYPH|nr:porin [Pseudaminobacter soli]MBS3651340.1 porin [Pseudaminobacter soli]